MFMKKKNYKILIGLFIGIFISITTVYAVTYIGSGSDLTYDNTSSGLTSTNVQDALDELYKYKECPKKFVCIKKKNTLAIGDYVKMTPTKSSYTTDTSKTGYTSTQTINPQELNLWRVISLNSDGTVDVISEHTSTTNVYFEGKTGYQNFVGYLNVLASQYENSTYTKGSRYFGYNGQTEYITDTSKFTNPAPWTCSTGESCNPVERQGGGDTLYQKDYDLVNNAIGTLKATKVDGLSSYYWIASRYYYYDSAASYKWYGRYIDSSGSLYYDYLYNCNYSSFIEYVNYNALRPVLTLKSGLKYSGSGTAEDPYKLSAN